MKSRLFQAVVAFGSTIGAGEPPLAVAGLTVGTALTALGCGGPSNPLGLSYDAGPPNDDIQGVIAFDFGIPPGDFGLSPYSDLAVHDVGADSGPVGLAPIDMCQEPDQGHPFGVIVNFDMSR